MALRILQEKMAARNKGPAAPAAAEAKVKQSEESAIKEDAADAPKSEDPDNLGLGVVEKNQALDPAEETLDLDGMDDGFDLSGGEDGGDDYGDDFD